MSILQTVPHTETKRRSPAAVIAAWWRESLDAAAAGSSDLDGCPPDDIERMAHDIGLTSSELRQISRHKSSDADLLFCRMAALDLDRAEVAAVDRATFLDLERVCTFCDCKGRCKRDLAARPDDARWQDYCPNVATLKMLDALPWSSRREW